MSRRMGDKRAASGIELVRRRADGPVSTAVVEAMAEARGSSPLALPPLADAVDPDALDDLCAGGQAGVTFDYAGHCVEVAGDGTVTVTTTGAGPLGPGPQTDA